MQNGETIKLLVEHHSKEVLVAAAVTAIAMVIGNGNKPSCALYDTAFALYEMVLDTGDVTFDAVTRQPSPGA